MTKRRMLRAGMAAAEDKKATRRAQAPTVSPYVARDPEAFARNLARAVEQGGRALAAYLKPREEGKPADASPRRRPRS